MEFESHPIRQSCQQLPSSSDPCSGQMRISQDASSECSLLARTSARTSGRDHQRENFECRQASEHQESQQEHRIEQAFEIARLLHYASAAIEYLQQTRSPPVCAGGLWFLQKGKSAQFITFDLAGNA